MQFTSARVQRASMAHSARVAGARAQRPLLRPAPLPRRPARGATMCAAAKLGIFYSTSSGKTQEAADLIKEVLGDAAAEPMDMVDVDDVATLKGFDGLIVGAPTWNTGADEGRSGTAWDDKIDEIKAADFAGAKVAVFGMGDSVSYGDYYCDAMEEIYTAFKAGGATLVGEWSTEGYEHTASKAELTPGKFCGLALDDDNQADLSEQRVKAWCAQVAKEMGVSVTVKT